MERLIKKAKYLCLLEGNDNKDLPFEVYIQPTGAEIQRVRNQSRFNSIRGVIYDDGTVIIWSGDVLHNCVNDYIINDNSTLVSIDINQFRFTYEGDWLIDCHNKYNLNDIIDLTIKYQPILNTIGRYKDEDYFFCHVAGNDTLDDPMPINVLKIYKEEGLDGIEKYFENEDTYAHITNKRLIKKSKYYESGQTNEMLLEIFVNPSSKEIKEAKATNEFDSIRGVVVNDNDVYIWRGDVLHNDINKYLPKDKQIIIDQFRFAYEPDFGWTVDTHNQYNWQEITELIKQYKNKLSNIGDINDLFHIFNSPRDFLGQTTIQDIENNKPRKEVVQDELIIFKNPSQKEIDAIIDIDGTGFGGTIVNNSDIYIWIIDEVDEEIEDYLGQSLEFKFIVKPSNSVTFINSYYGTWKSLVNIIIKNEHKLAMIMDIDNMTIKFSQDFKDKIFDSATLQELKDYQMDVANNEQQQYV